jgi:hypothetical protein
MTNNKHQTALEWFIEELEYKGDLRETPSIRNIQLNIDTSDYMELKVQAKEMEKEQHATTWDTAMDKLNARGGNIVRAYVDFDDYYNETFGADHIVDTNKMI